MSAEASEYEVKAGLQEIGSFRITGISVRTDNEKATEDINGLWEQFFAENVGQKLDGIKTEDIIYAVYSDYEGDHTKPYRFTIGYKVNDGAALPEGFSSVTTEAADYAMMSAGGEQPKALIETWTAIWQSDLDRRFKTDFEIYGPRFFEEGVHEVIICIGVDG